MLTLSGNWQHNHYKTVTLLQWKISLLSIKQPYTFPSIPSIPFAASSVVAYLTKPNPFEHPETRSVTTRAAIGREMGIKIYSITRMTTGGEKTYHEQLPRTSQKHLSPSVEVRLLNPTSHRKIRIEWKHQTHKKGVEAWYFNSNFCNRRSELTTAIFLMLTL